MFRGGPTGVVYYQAGWRIGRHLEVGHLEEIPAKIEALGVGNLKLHSVKEDAVIVKWYECLTCSHLPPVGESLCYLEAGLLAGALSRVLGRSVEVEETKCWGTGEKYCQMEAAIGEVASQADRCPLSLPEEDSRLLLDLTFQAVHAVREARRAALVRDHLADGGVASLSIGEALFQKMPIGLVVADRQGIILNMNRACEEALGSEARRAVGRPIALTVPESKYARVLQTGRPEVWEFREARGTKAIVIEAPLWSKGEVVGVLGQVFSVESELVDLLLQKLRQLEAEVNYYRERLQAEQQSVFAFGRIKTFNRRMRHVLEMARKAAPTNATVLILGESGTGKEVLARAVHQESPRRQGPFVKIDCAAIPEELMESELFGYEEGAFTGAKRGGKPGKIEMAAGGTLFLDEIGDMSLGMQAKLLRVLQDKEFERVGGTKPVKVDVRVIAATNKNLEKLVRDGRFREDLFYRLNVVTLLLPPLRERLEDIPLLVESILERLEGQHGRKLNLVPATVDCLKRYHWPGNVRELENVLERAAIMADQGTIYPSHLPPSLQQGSRLTQQVRPLEEIRSEAEKEAILLALDNSGGHIARAAKALGVSRQALYAKMARYGLIRR